MKSREILKKLQPLSLSTNTKHIIARQLVFALERNISKEALYRLCFIQDKSITMQTIIDTLKHLGIKLKSVNYFN